MLGYVSIALVLAACSSAYFYIRDVTGASLPAAVGGLCYGLSAFGVHRIAQVDNAFLTLVVLPAAMLAIRRARQGNLIWPFAGVTLSLSALAFWGFLQEVAYAFVFLAAYALYRAAIARTLGPRAVTAVVIVSGTGAILALLFAAPRLVTLGSELFQLARSSSILYPGYQELLRFFHEGIYGRYFGEGRQIGNSLNLSEGLQLVSSATVPLFVCWGVLRPSTRLERVAGLLLMAMFLALFPIYRTTTTGSWPSQELVNISLFFGVLSVIVLWRHGREHYLDLGARRGRLVLPIRRPPDTAFHLLALVLLLALIVIPEGYSAVHVVFGRRDFTHARLSVLIVLPLCSLFAIYLAEMTGIQSGQGVAWPGSLRSAATAFGILTGAVFAAWLLHGRVIDQLVPNTAFQFGPYQPNTIVIPPVAVKIVLTAIVLAAVLAGLRWKPHRSFDVRLAAAIVVGAFASVETVTYAHFKVNGSHTWTYPVPFGGTFNYMNVSPSVMRPPREEQLIAFGEKLEVADFRSALLGQPSLFSGVFTPHISQFWRARLIGGYGTGVPERLAGLPWPVGVASLRVMELNSMLDVNPDLLSLMNVKYLVIPTADLYFNTASPDSDGSHTTLVPGDTISRVEVVNIDGISFGVIENSLAPLPRYFLVEQVTGVREIPRMTGGALEAHAYSTDESHNGPRVSALAREKIDRLTSHSLVEDFRGSQTFDASGQVHGSFRDDVIDFRVTPSTRDRFLIVNERYHPDWRASDAAGDIRVFPTNVVMMGIQIPAGLDRIQLRFTPFSSTRSAHLMMLLAVTGFVVVTGTLWLTSRRVHDQTQARRPNRDGPGRNGNGSCVRSRGQRSAE